jgi:RHS repeat-associated protein
MPNGQGGISGAAGSPAYSWQYDENHQRVKETRVITGAGAGTRTIWYAHPDNQGSLGFEREENSNPSVVNNRHFLTAGGRPVGVLITTGALATLGSSITPAALGSTAATRLEYWHRDHLGSLAATTDHLGTVTQRNSYDPFGKRRAASGTYDAAGTVVQDWDPTRNAGTGRGFTGNEELDDIGLINMNGRVYDDTLGLFVQADPHVTDPYNLQSYNRYGYVLNNPSTLPIPVGLKSREDPKAPKSKAVWA